MVTFRSMSSDFNIGILSEHEQNSAHNNDQPKEILINFEKNGHTTIQFKCELQMR